MGRASAIANPKCAGPEMSRSCASEQRIGGGAVRGGLVPVRRNPRYFRFELRHALGQFVLRIGREILGRELACRVTSGPWKVIIHGFRLPLVRNIAI